MASTSLTPTQLAHFDETRQPKLIAGFTILLVLANLAVVVRIGTQSKLSRRIIAEDYFIILAAV